MNLLYYLVKDQQIVETMDADDFSKACLCNLEYYMFILDKSVSAAAHALQIWFDCGKIIQKMKLSGEPVKKEEYSELFQSSGSFECPSSPCKRAAKCFFLISEI